MSAAAADEVVIVTGSGGHIGSTLIEFLARRDPALTLIGMDRPGAPEAPSPAINVPMDLSDDESVSAALQHVREQFGTRIASVIHLAAFASFEEESDPRFEKVNVEGTQRFLHRLKDHLTIEQFVYSSTMLVHSPTEPGIPIRPGSPKDPAWGYPQSKLQAEAVVRDEHGSVPFVILRIAGAYNDDGGLPALEQQIQRIYEKQIKGRVFPGNSHHGQAAVHLDDLLDLFKRTIERRHELPAESTFMVGEPDVYSYAQLQQKIGELLHGDPWEFQEIPKSLAKSGAWLQEVALPKEKEPFVKHWMIDIADAHYELDISATREKLGWEPKHRLIDTLPRIMESLRTDPRGWYERHQMAYPGNGTRPRKTASDSEQEDARK